MRDFQTGKFTLPLVIILAESLLLALAMLREMFLQVANLIEDEFDVRIHGTTATLEPSEEIVRR